MKKIIVLLLFLIANIGMSQTWTLQPNQINGKFDLVYNATSYLGKSSNTINSPVIFDITNIDTSIWVMIPNSINGKYTIAENKVTFMDKDSGKVRANFTYLLNNPTLSSLGLYTTSIIPTTNGLYDIGSTALKYRNIYAGNIILGTSATTTAGSLKYDGGNFFGYNGASWLQLDNTTAGSYTYVVGDASTNGSWRFSATSGGSLIFETRVAGTWIEKGSFTQ